MLVFLVFVSLFSYIYGQTTQFSCPSGYTPPNSCTSGPCRCAQFIIYLIATTKDANGVINTEVSIQVTNFCDSTNPVYSVWFSLSDYNDASFTLTSYNTLPYPEKANYQWTVSSTDQRGTSASPDLNWITFTPQTSPNTQMVSGGTDFNWDILTFYVEGYYPTFPWFFQMHQGANWDTFGPISAWLCSCANCDSGWVQRVISPCTLGYPDSSTNRAQSVFNEDIIMYSFAISGNLLQAFYTDEHPLCLGIYEITLSNGTIYTANVTAPPSAPTCVFSSDGSLQLGFTATTGPLAGVDTNGPANSCPTGALTCPRPVYPAMFFTDISSNPSSRAGDWQQGGQAYAPNKVCGVWKNATITPNPGTAPYFQVVAGPDPNYSNQLTGGWNLGAQADYLPIGFALNTAQSYGCELAWDLDSLGLLPSSTYRFQMMFHDGDQHWEGGDVGQACIIASSACPPGFTNAATGCTTCDTFPLPVDNSWTWYCLPNGADYELIKIPRSQVDNSFYAGGFIPGPNVTANGYAITCNCTKIIVPCPNQCCGFGTCLTQNGTCQCNTGSGIPSGYKLANTTCCPIPLPPPVPTPTPTPPIVPGHTPAPVPVPSPVSKPIPCYNGGAYCSGNGQCADLINCSCSVGWTGPACNQSTTPPPPPITCQTVENKTTGCQECLNVAASVQLSCTWCVTNPNNISIGFCGDYNSCYTNYTLLTCTPPVKWIPPPCPDNCTGHGVCINSSNQAWSVTQLQQSDPFAVGNISYCLCFGGFTGINCGQFPPQDNTVAIAAGVSSAVLAGIIVGIALAIAGLGGGSAYAYSQLAGGGADPVVGNNPIYCDPNQTGHNPLHKGS